VPDILRMLERDRFWFKHPVSASRLRGRVEKVLDWSRVKQYRSGPNPAIWRGNLEHSLPGKRRLHTVANYPALPYQQLPEFWAELAQESDVQASALRFQIATAVRPGDINGAGDPDNPRPMKWAHVNFDTGIWTVPETKTRANFRVPLSQLTCEILAHMRLLRDPKTDVVFPGQAKSGSVGRSTACGVIARINRRRGASGLPPFIDPQQGGREVTAHGFRSSFFDWVREIHSTRVEIADMALAHAIGSETKRAYGRSDLLELRRELLNDYADYVQSVSILQDAKNAA
jgi:integrase